MKIFKKEEIFEAIRTTAIVGFLVIGFRKAFFGQEQLGLTYMIMAGIAFLILERN